MLRTAPAHGTRGLVVEMTDGTSQANAEFRGNVSFYYDLVKANVERIATGLTAELESLPVMAVGVTPAAVGEDARKLRCHRGHLARCLRQDARLCDLRITPSTSPEVSPRSPRRAMPTAGLARSSPPASSPMSTTSPTPTAAAPTAGAAWPPTAGNRRTAQASTTFGRACNAHRVVVSTGKHGMRQCFRPVRVVRTSLEGLRPAPRACVAPGQ
jgi:hypothetical protein